MSWRYANRYLRVLEEMNWEALVKRRIATHQHATPLLIDRLDQSGTARALDRVLFDLKAHDEAWLQRLIYRFPQVPVAS
jgi:hypothetical protein